MQGDILFLHMREDPIRAGEIVVFNIEVSILLYASSSYFSKLSIVLCQYKFA